MGLEMTTTALQDGSRLIAPDGMPFFSLSVNYNGHLSPYRERFELGGVDPAQLQADFRRIRDLGANTVRAFVTADMAKGIDGGSWEALDAIVEAARRNRLLLILCLAGSGVSELVPLARRAGQVAARYVSDPTILALDLMNHPGFATIALARGEGQSPSLAGLRSADFAGGLTEKEALHWARGEGGVPDWVDDGQATRYASAFAVFRRMLREAMAWVEGQLSPANIIDFVRSPEARPWIPLLDLLDGLLARWLEPQVGALRAADPRRLVTVGWSDPLLASLRSNEALDILSLSRFPAVDARWISHHLDVARRLRLAFPTKPVLLTAFGMPTHEIAPPEAAVAESGIWLGAFERGLAGAGKWTMRDLPADSSSIERSYGLISSTGESKPSAYALPALARYLRSTTRPQGNLEFISGPAGSFDYRFTADDALFSSGRDVIDEGGLRWEGRGTAQLFADWSCQGEVVLLATAPGQVTIDMSRLLGVVERPGLTVATDGVPLPHERRGNSLSLWVAPGQQVVCRLGLQSVDAKIATVRPKRGSSLEDADAAIFTANLTYPGTRMAVPGGFSPTVILWCARGESPARAVARGVRRLADSGERRIPVWEFDDVDLRLPPDKVERLTFSLSVTGIPYRTNVWVLDARAAGALTAGPDVISPEGDLPAEAIEAQISAVHLHEQLARSGAKRVDIRATLSASNVGRAALADLLRGSASETGVWLVSARDGAVGERTVRGTLVSNIKGDAEFVFRGVELEAVAGSTGQRPSSVASGLHPFSVASGLQPARVEPEAVTAATGELHFWIEVDGIPTRSSFWTYTT